MIFRASLCVRAIDLPHVFIVPIPFVCEGFAWYRREYLPRRHDPTPPPLTRLIQPPSCASMRSSALAQAIYFSAVHHLPRSPSVVGSVGCDPTWLLSVLLGSPCGSHL